MFTVTHTPSGTAGLLLALREPREEETHLCSLPCWERERERNWTWEINQETGTHQHVLESRCWLNWTISVVRNVVCVLTKYIFSVHFHHHQRPSPICSETPTSHREFKDSLRGFWEIPPVCKCVERHTPDCESEALKVSHTISWDAETYGRPSLHDSYSQRET